MSVKGKIIRVKHDSNYFCVANAPFSDERLSWDARGMYGYFMSKPDDWLVRPYDVVNVGPKGPDGKPKERKGGMKVVRAALRELEAAGYLKRERIRTKDGRWEWISTLYELPQPVETPYTPQGEMVEGQTVQAPAVEGEIYQVTNLANTELANTNGKNLEKDSRDFLQNHAAPKGSGEHAEPWDSFTPEILHEFEDTYYYLTKLYPAKVRANDVQRWGNTEKVRKLLAAISPDRWPDVLKAALAVNLGGEYPKDADNWLRDSWRDWLEEAQKLSWGGVKDVRRFDQIESFFDQTVDVP
jgi:hypothetical protein